VSRHYAVGRRRGRGGQSLGSVRKCEEVRVDSVAPVGDAALAPLGVAITGERRWRKVCCCACCSGCLCMAAGKSTAGMASTVSARETPIPFSPITSGEDIFATNRCSGFRPWRRVQNTGKPQDLHHATSARGRAMPHRHTLRQPRALPYVDQIPASPPHHFPPRASPAARTRPR
jgi:hypothetical protein